MPLLSGPKHSTPECDFVLVLKLTENREEGSYYFCFAFDIFWEEGGGWGGEEEGDWGGGGGGGQY